MLELLDLSLSRSVSARYRPKAAGAKGDDHPIGAGSFALLTVWADDWHRRDYRLNARFSVLFVAGVGTWFDQQLSQDQVPAKKNAPQLRGV
ncbi:MAG: hypothetical protein NTZ53_03640 [Cyanobacteria bacterium]|nr:hypothetical protein [Cyanobacteriota bacterium]